MNSVEFAEGGVGSELRFLELSSGSVSSVCLLDLIRRCGKAMRWGANRIKSSWMTLLSSSSE